VARQEAGSSEAALPQALELLLHLLGVEGLEGVGHELEVARSMLHLLLIGHLLGCKEGVLALLAHILLRATALLVKGCLLLLLASSREGIQEVIDCDF
jgi:hypothetical protein